MSSFLHEPRISATESGFLSHFVVVFLTRSGCHLCDDARPIVVREIGRAGGSMVETDIDEDDRLTRDYGMRIPVVLGSDGTVLDEGIIDGKRLRTALRSL